jgi:hypothetical protein
MVTLIQESIKQVEITLGKSEQFEELMAAAVEELVTPEVEEQS